MTTELLNINQLMREFDTSFRVIEVALEKAGIEPVFTHVRGTKTTKLYDPAAARPAVEAYMKASIRQRKKHGEAEAEAPQAAPDFDLSAVTSRLDVLARTVNETASQVEALTEAVAQLQSQGPVLLKALANGHLDLSNKTLALQETIEAMGLKQAPAPSAEPSAPAAEAPPARTKPRVVVVGLLDSQGAMIQREFSDAFDLTIYAGSELRGKSKGFIGKVISADHVLVMTRFVGHSAEDLVRAAGAKAIRVTGALTELRDRLTALFVELGETNKAAA